MLKFRVLVGLLVMATVLFGANVNWKDSNSSGSWSDGTKWSTAAPPQTGDTPYLDKTNIEVTRTEANTNDVFLQFYGPGIAATNAVLNIEGGSMKVNRISTSNETFRIAYGTGSSGRVNMSGGLIEVGDFDSGLGDLQVGRAGTGELFMTGGEIRIARYLYVGSTSTGRGHVKIYDDAVIRVGNSLFRGSTSYSKIDIGGGQLIFTGDKRQHVANWQNAGYMVAYDGHPLAEFVITYDATANETVVTSILPNVNIASEPLPWDQQNVNCDTNLSLIWVKGENISEQHIYLGTNAEAVSNAQSDDASGIFRGVVGDDVYFYAVPASQLDDGVTYYWRIDSVDSGTVCKGDIWSFTAKKFNIPVAGDLDNDNQINFFDFALASSGYVNSGLSWDNVISDIIRNWLVDRNVARQISAPFDTSMISAPQFPQQLFSIVEFNAVSGGYVKNTTAIQNAIDACSAAGGGRVIVPSGIWLTGPLVLRSNVNLHLQDGAEIRFSTDYNDYLPKIYIYPNNRPDMGYERPKPCIYANNAVNIAITGQGSAVLNAQGRSYSDNTYWRQFRVDFISPVNSENILIDGVSVMHGTTWNIVPRYCTNMTIRNINLVTKGPATDGIDVYSTRDVLIEHCYIACGDDTVVMNTDIDEAGWAINIPTERVVVRYNYFQTPMAAMAVGSGMSAGVRNIQFQDNYVGKDTGCGFWIKSRLGRGGVVENIWVKDITMEEIIQADNKAINISMYYSWGATPITVVPPVFRNIFIQNVKCEQATFDAGGLLQLRGLPESYIDNVNISNVTGYQQGGFGIFAEYINNTVFSSIKMNPYPLSRAAVRLQNVKNTVVENSSCPNNIDLFFQISGDQTENVCLKNNVGASNYLSLGADVSQQEVLVDECP